MTDKHITRRSFVKAGGWSVPIVAAAAAIPASAASTTGEWVVTSTESSYVQGGSFGVLFRMEGVTEADLNATTWDLVLNGAMWIPTLGPRNLDQTGGRWVVAFNGDWPFDPAVPVEGFEITVNATAHTPDGDKLFAAVTELRVL
ncbi:hypothetical protein QF046_002642 [Microbacterium sp. W4I4]|uniref:hypothetical protein n=1 Tax=Microbacterium sp. W4I4 TaxID=3042295 RepID=UPI00278979F0|nr:hypothetical protein [Microbacterium sp. W4I4]MDQ0615001.1 hypothetical protein [Microbacterium sp. W4I4]